MHSRPAAFYPDTVPLRPSPPPPLQPHTQHSSPPPLSRNPPAQVAKLKTEVEGFEAEALVQEAKKDSSLQVASQKTLEYGQVVLSTDNVFNRCRSRSKIGHPAESNPLHQLEVVGNYVSDLGAIIRAHREQARKAAKGED